MTRGQLDLAPPVTREKDEAVGILPACGSPPSREEILRDLEHSRQGSSSEHCYQAVSRLSDRFLTARKADNQCGLE